MRITRFEGGLVGIYIVINRFCIGLGIKSLLDLLTCSGIIVLINLILLFLSNRTSMLINFVSISFYTYYLVYY
jgi:hypothetical protein